MPNSDLSNDKKNGVHIVFDELLRVQQQFANDNHMNTTNNTREILNIDESNSNESFLYLALGMAENGIKVTDEQPTIKDTEWIEKSANLNNVVAQNYLGKYYEDKNLYKAVYWYTKAIDQGYISAQLNLGTCLLVNLIGEYRK